MLKLHQLYIKKLLIPFILLFFVVGGVVFYTIKDIYISQTKEELLSDVNLLAIELKNTADLNELAKKIRKNLHIRLTIIKDDGTVLADSDANSNKMDNHKFRPEIVEARKSGIGSSIRYSHTLNKNLLYVAKKINSGGEIVYIRVAKKIKSLNEQIYILALKVFALLVVFFMIIFYITYNIGNNITKEVEKILKFLINLTKKKKTLYVTSNISKEFYDITKLLTKVAAILEKRDKQKNKYNKRLKLANEQKDDIISAISHEFKNPITVINGYSQTLLEDDNINDSIRKRFLEKIFSNGKRLSTLIDTLRLSIRLDNNKTKLNYEKFSVDKVAGDIIENLSQAYNERQIELLGEKNVYIKADKILFEIALSNLIENAIKYSEDKVTVEVSTTSVAVRDSGIGMDEKEIKNITKKFYRINQNGWDNSLGLGLSIVSNIISLHGFKLEIKSKKNEGSEFIISWK